MPRASELKKGSIVEIDENPHMVEDLQITTPTARGGASLYRLRFRNLSTKHKLDKTFKGDAMLKPVDFERRDVQFSYQQQGSYAFMDLSDYSEIVMLEEDLGTAADYITEDMEGIQALVCNGRVIGVELPPVAELKIEECSPGMRGASATARTKPATLTTGLVVQVPEYLEPGEMIRVDTRTGKFSSRA